MLYEQYRRYFTDRAAGIRPGGDMFILIREGLAAWLAADGPAPIPEIRTKMNPVREAGHGELACLLASIVLGGTGKWAMMGKYRQNICQGPDTCTSGNPRPIR